ncbi:MAG: monovalent cation/H+ antiporter complex subunit F [Myxococcota bacterium]
MNAPNVLTVVMGMFMLAMVLAFWRLLRGPTQSDRVVALDLLTTTAAAVVGLYALVMEQMALLDVSLVLGLVSFLGTLAMAYYVERTREVR